MEQNLHSPMLAGREPSPAEWSKAMEQLLHAKGGTPAPPTKGAFVRGQVGPVKQEVLALVGANPGITAPTLCRLMPDVSAARVNCAISQLFKTSHVSRDGEHGSYRYRLKGA